MANKVMFVGAMPSQSERDMLAALCGVTPAKFEALFDYGTLFTKEVLWINRDAALRADALLKETTYPILVLVGARVAEAFGVAEQPLIEPFALGIEEELSLADGKDQTEQVRLVIKILASQADKFYKKKGRRLAAKRLMQSLVIMSQQPATEDEARACCAIVRKALADDMDLITKLHVEAIEKALEKGEIVDNFDLRKLMVEYARNVKLWVKTDETLSS